MNSQSFTLAERLIPATYLQQAAASKKSRENLIRVLIEQSSPGVVTAENASPEHKSRVRKTQSHITDESGILTRKSMSVLFFDTSSCHLKQWVKKAMVRRRKR
ncbi:hypothetical protein J6590_015951 [Homalodisca vitripennis]|nr:hypothetical protein J6590_015951 [Homalodisca vitripennis]